MKPFTTISAVLLGIISLLQLLRFALGWPIIVNGFAIPLWASAVAFLVAGGLSLMLWRENRLSSMR